MSSSRKLLTAVMALSLLTIGAQAQAGESADEKAIRHLIDGFSTFFSTFDTNVLNSLYTDDAVSFSRNGTMHKGKTAVVAAMGGAHPPGANGSPPPAGPRRQIVTDGVHAEGRLGYVYGRLCVPTASGGYTDCNTRWFLVTQKGKDGHWRVQYDIDLPYKGPDAAH